MDQWAEVRRQVLVEGRSKRSVLKEHGMHWKTLEKILSHSEPPGYRQALQRSRPVIGPFIGVIQSIIEADKLVHKKQRHTAKRIWDRLKEEYGYEGGYTQVKEVVAHIRARSQEAFVPLIHPMGEAQVDFGHADVVLDGEKVKVAIFVMALPYSDAFFMCVFPRECPEAFFEGHVRAFEFLGGVPKRIIYDNTSSAVSKILAGRERKLTPAFLRVVSHYLFETHFCRVRRANEKGVVENLVGFGRRNYLVPVPNVSDLEHLNEDLRASCLRDLERTLRGKEKSKAELLKEEREALLPLPKQRFEGRRIEKTQASSLSLVRFDCNDYSVPTEHAHHPVCAVGSISEVKLIVDSKVVARHKRCWKKERVIFEPVHYLALLERKPGALDFARPLCGLELPGCFGVLRRRLERELGDAGTREYIRCLRLLEKVTPKELTEAVEQALDIGALGPDALRLILEHRRERPAGLFSLDGRPHLKLVQVSSPDLSVYGQLGWRAER
jgi:transposase